MPVITTARLTLREFEDADRAAVHEYAADPRVCEFVEWGPNSEQETRNFVTRAIHSRKEKPRVNFEFAIVLNEEKKLIGGCGIMVAHPKFSLAAIGYVLNQNYWGRGLATEAARAVVRFGFEKLQLHRIYATCDAMNSGSENVMKKCGMRREGHFIEERMIKNRWRDTLLYAVLEHEWKQSELSRATDVSIR